MLVLMFPRTASSISVNKEVVLQNKAAVINWIISYSPEIAYCIFKTYIN